MAKEIPVEQIQAALRRPFAASEVKYKPGRVAGGRAVALPYVTARVVMDRLDQVLDIDGWRTEVEPQADGTVLCRLFLYLGGVWLDKCDVGAPSEQPDAGDRRKAAACVPLGAEILTRSGWKAYSQLVIGEDVLGYDTSADVCRWTQLLDVNVFHGRPVWQLASKAFNAVCTADHKWAVRRRGKDGVSLKRTCDLDSHDMIVVSAVAEGGNHPLTIREAAIIGWLATDGSASFCVDRRPGNRRPHLRAVIFQSKEPYRSDILALLGGDAVEHVTPAGERTFPGRTVPSATRERCTFYLRSPFAHDLLKRAGLLADDNVDWTLLSRLILGLSVEAREAMLVSMMDGDGQHRAAGQRKFGKKRKPGVMDAFDLLATLQGVALGGRHGSFCFGQIPLRTLRVSRHTWAKCLAITVSDLSTVWCPTTKFGTWVMRWHDQISITGNSDSLKRAAVLWGVGRYLYDGPPCWADYDTARKRFVGDMLWTPEGPVARDTRKPSAPVRRPSGPAKPVTGAELRRRLQDKDGQLAGRGLCRRGELIKHVLLAGQQLDYPADLAEWPAVGFDLAVQATKTFEAALTVHE